MNVLVYNGNGTSPNAVQQTHSTLRSLLGHAHDVIKVDAKTLKTEPWEETCALLAIPGGRDVPYCEDLQGETNARIRRYVSGGGRYIGFCAGAYYASQRIEFEKDDPVMAVVGARELAFYPGLSRGAMFPGFVYNSEKGARAVSVHIVNTKEDINMYYNGGGYFSQPNDPRVKVLATYNDPGACTDELHPAAAVQCTVGQGSAVLIAAHPEYDVSTMDLSEAENSEQMKTVLKQSEAARLNFLCTALGAMGLHTMTSARADMPAITPLYLASMTGEVVSSIASQLEASVEPTTRLLRDSNDTFHLVLLDDYSASLENKLSALSVSDRNAKDTVSIVYSKAANTPQCPPRSLTPQFDLEVFFKALRERRSQEWGGGQWYDYGNTVLYAHVVTSTQTILDRNSALTKALPTGTVCLASNQIAGRGRGRNSWISQEGAVQFSLLVRHSVRLRHAPVVFVQYLIALAVVESIRTREGYEGVPLRLKWPNDIYADLPDGLKKVGGLLVNSSFGSDEFVLVIGTGINLSNARPTVSINQVIQQHNPSLATLCAEDVLADILVTFEKFYTEFCDKGMGSWFLDKYYDRWLHSDKLVTLTTHDNVQARIVGITRDYGMLEVVQVDGGNKRYTLQPDGNSFDMLKGLIIKKQ